MESNREDLVQQLTEMVMKPGGKTAMRFALNALGAIPVVGGAIAGASASWGEIEQNRFNEILTEWVLSTDIEVN